MGRPKDPGSRRSRAERKRAQRAAEAAARLAQKGEPNCKVAERRQAFSFYRAEKGGSIDPDIHDALGQLQVLGYLENHGFESKDLRDIGRDYGDLHAERYEATAVRSAEFERRSASSGDPPPRTARDDYFDRLDDAMPRPSMERTVVYQLVVQYRGRDQMVGWAQRLVSYELAKRGVPNVLVDTHSHGHDLYMLGCAIRGLLQLKDASLAPRFARRAA